MGNGQVNNPQFIEKQLFSRRDEESSHAFDHQNQRESSICFDLQKQLNYSLFQYQQTNKPKKQFRERQQKSSVCDDLNQKDQLPLLQLQQQQMLKQETPHQMPTIPQTQTFVQVQKEQQSIQNQHQVVQPLGPKTFIKKFDANAKGKTVILQEQDQVATQKEFYFQNEKLILTDQLPSRNCQICFRLDNLKYCVGFGIALKEVIEKHSYNYKSISNQLGHGLYIVTSQGFSWSHSQKDEDDIFREGFNQLYSGAKVTIWLEGQSLKFKFKKKEFELKIRSEIVKKYTVCFCAYLHEKQDGISIVDG